MYKPIILILVLFLTACNSNRDPRYSGFHFPYKVDIHQGNNLSSEDLAKLRIGMNKSEVVAIIGTPVLTDDFNNNHWIYTSLNKIKGDKIEQKQIDLFFVNNQLQEIKK